MYLQNIQNKPNQHIIYIDNRNTKRFSVPVFNIKLNPFQQIIQSKEKPSKPKNLLIKTKSPQEQLIKNILLELEEDKETKLILQIASNLQEMLNSEQADQIFSPNIKSDLQQNTETLERIKQKSIFYPKEMLEQDEVETCQKVEAVQYMNTSVEQQRLQQQARTMYISKEAERMPTIYEIDNDEEQAKLNRLTEDENVIYTLIKNEYEYHKQSIQKEQILQYLKEFTIINVKDECRTESSHKEGGKECKNPKIKECLRKIGKEIIKQIGRKIISGNFNLTQVSFPIKAMIPQSALEKALYSTCLFPLYINLAFQTTNYILRFKYLICATIGNFYINCGFLKPLNPIIGETCIGCYPDGSKLYCEQISHHPPISYFLVYGPDNNYIFYGNYNYESNAGMNSLSLHNKGTRHIKFKDGQCISYNFAKEVYGGSFFGAMKVESKGSISFKDAQNKIEAEIVFDSVKKRPTDYFSGFIKQNGVVVSKCYGTYMGFIEFDGERYWDYRYIIPYMPVIQKSSLGSDQSKRLDKIHLRMGNIEKAQGYKVQYEELQRNDEKLRRKFDEQLKKKQKK